MNRRCFAVLLTCVLARSLVGAASAGVGDPDFGIAPETWARLDRLEAAATASPDEARAWARLAEECLAVARTTREHNDLHRAEAAFERVLTMDPEAVEAHVGLAYARIGLHRFGDALVSARQAAALAPERSDVLALLGDAHLALGHQVEARAIFEALGARELTMGSLSRLALAAADRGDRHEAERLMRDAAEAGELLGAPAQGRAWCQEILGEWAWESGRVDEARRSYSAALELDAGSPHARMMLARLDAREGRVDEADAVLSELCRTHPRPVHWLALADVLRARGGSSDIERAGALVRLAEAAMMHELEDHDVGHARELAELWLAHGGDAARAAELALRDLHEVRQDAGAYETAAWALHRAGRSGEALPLALRSLRANPAQARAAWRAGMICSEIGQRREAGLLLRRALELNPELDASMRAEAERVIGELGQAGARGG